LKRHLVWLLLISSVVRFAGWLSTRDVAPWGDEATELAHAWDLAEHGKQHVWWPPLSGWVCAGIFRLAGGYDYPAVRLAWVVLDVTNVVLLYLLATMLFDPRTAFAAACLYAVYPAAIARAVYVTSEISSILFSLLAMICLARLWNHPRQWWALLAGICLGLAALSRGAMLPWLFLFPLAAAGTLLGGPAGAQRRRAAAIMLAGGLLVWLPWVARNYMVGHQWILVSTNASYNLRLSAESDAVPAQDNLFLFHPRATSEQRALRRNLFGGDATRHPADDATTGRMPATPIAKTTPEEEFERNAAEKRRALDAIRADPGHYLITCLGRLARFWALDTHVKHFFGTERIGRMFSPGTLLVIGASNLVYVFAASVGLLGLVVIGQQRVRLATGLYVLGPMLAYTLVYAKPRYHLSVMPILITLAVWAISHAREWRPQVTRSRLMWIALSWAFLAWTWVAWIIFCITSRLPEAGG
jgi:4-amino-4-deoxy-L-arabinose transferase-like glycosyltransferase